MSGPPYASVGVTDDFPQQRQRAVVGRPFVAQFTFGADDAGWPDAVDTAAGTVSVVVKDSEGYEVASGDATVGAVASDGTQVASFNMTAAELPQRDLLTVTWTATIDSVSVAQTSSIDVCDARLFPWSDYTLYPEIGRKNFSTARLEAERMAAEDFLERECGRAFTGRYGVEQHLVRPYQQRSAGVYGWGTPGWGYGPTYGFGPRGVGRLQLRRPNVQAIRSITRTYRDSAGAAQTYSVNIAWAEVDEFGSSLLYHSERSNSQWDGLFGNLTIAYEHGQYVADVRRVCSILARHRLLKGPLDDRATQLAVEGGGSVNLLTPGVQGSVTGIPEVDVFIARYSAAGAVGFISGA